MSSANMPASGMAVYRRLLGYAVPYWRVFIIAVVGMVLSAVVQTGFAALMKPMLDGSFVARDPDVIRLVPLMLIGLFVLQGIAGFLSTYCMVWVGRSVVKDVRGQLFSHLLHLPTALYDKTSSGQLLSKLIYNVEQLAQASTNAVTIIIKDSLTVIGLIAWMFYLNPLLALLFLFTTPLIAISLAYANKRFRRINARIQTSMGQVAHAAEEAIGGHRVIKAFLGQQHEAAHFEKTNESNRRLNMKVAATGATSVAIIQLLAASAVASVIFLATRDAALDSISVGSFMSFVVAMVLLLGPTKRLTTVNAMLQRGIAAADSIFTFFDLEGEIDTGAIHIERARGAVAYHNVSFYYAEDKGEVLRNISFNVKPGQTVALVGRSGSGKSTLVSLLPRFYNPCSGSITLDGHDISSLKLDSLRDQMAMVSQDVVLFDDTIGRNIAYGRLYKASEAEIIKAAEAAHAMEFIRELPEGLNTLVGGNGVLLSGGQRQRLAIARALLKNAPVLILDEATSALDSESERAIQAGLEALMRHRTTLVIAHRLSTIEKADVIVVLHEGRIIEQGSHLELLKRKGHYAALYKMQFHEVNEKINPLMPG